MFRLKRANEKLSEFGAKTLPEKPAAESRSRAKVFSEAVIHTMPNSFFPKKKPPMSRKTLLLIAGAVLLVLILVSIGLVLLTQPRVSSTNKVVIPVNINQNINSAQNSNANINSNINTNVNQNLNINSNVNTNINIENIPVQKLKTSLDSDNDSLTDKEEGLYNTDPNKPDTDDDGFVDGVELTNLYNPRGFTPVRLEDSGLVNRYTNTTYKYHIFYPVKWLARALDETNQEAIFTSDTGEFMQVIVQENINHLSLIDWYKTQVPEINIEQIEYITNKSKSLTGIRNLDGLTIYFGNENYIYSIAYNIGTKTELNFSSTLTMMYKSFELDGLAAAVSPAIESQPTGLESPFPAADVNTNINLGI